MSFPLTYKPLAIIIYTNFLAFTFRERNSVARTQNSMRGFSDQELSRLVNTNTAEEIPQFPATPTILNCTTGVVLNQVLTALALGTDGTLEERRTRLRIAIGKNVHRLPEHSTCPLTNGQLPRSIVLSFKYNVNATYRIVILFLYSCDVVTHVN